MSQSCKRGPTIEPADVFFGLLAVGRPTVHDPDFRVLSVLAGQPPGMKGSDSWSDRARRELPSKRIFHAGDGEPLVLAELDGSGPAGAGLSEPGV